MKILYVVLQCHTVKIYIDTLIIQLSYSDYTLFTYMIDTIS